MVEASLFYSDLLDFLQALLPYNYLFHRIWALQVLSGDVDLVDYAIDLSKWQPAKHSIQVVGPPGRGKATLVKSIIQKVMRYTPDVLLLEIPLVPSETVTLDSRTVIRSFVHQIISQRPVLFSHIRLLHVQYYKSHGIRRQETLWTYLRILLGVSRQWKIAIAADNVHLLPKAVQACLVMLEELLQSLDSNYLFVSSSTDVVLELCPSSQQILDLGLDRNRRDSLIKAKVKTVMLSQPAFQASARAKRFRDSVETLERTLLGWSSLAVSWVQKAARPLETRELAVAIAFEEGRLKLAELIPRIPESIESDIARHLNAVLRLDGDLVHFSNADIREFLVQKPPSSQKAPDLQLLTQGQLASLCLNYIAEVVTAVSRDVCLAQMSWRGRVQDSYERQAELGFLEYAVRHWPTHYHAYIQSRAQSKTLDRQQEPSKPRQGPGDEFDSLDNQVMEFLADEFEINEWYQLFCVKSVPEEGIAEKVNAMEVAVELGLSPIVNRTLTTIRSGATELGEHTIDPFLVEEWLNIAVRHGHSDLVDVFLREGAKRGNAILEASSLGRVDYLEKLLPTGMLRDCNQYKLEVALHKAAQSGNLLAVKFFDRVNIDWSWKDSEGRTVLHAAAIGGEVNILRHIINKRVLNINVEDEDGTSPLILATKLNHAPFVEELCEQGADVTLDDNNGEIALHHGIIKDPRIVTSLLRHHSNPVEPNEREQTPLHLACQLGNPDILVQLVDALKFSEAINIRNEENETPLHIAAAYGHFTVVNYLLDKGADPSLKDNEDRKPIHLAATNGHLDVFETLYQRSGPISNEVLVMQSSSMGHLLIVRFLLRKHKSANFQVEGEYPLAVAASKGYTELVRLLLEWRANPNLPNKDGRTPLHHAVSGGHKDVVIGLLAAGADPDPLDKERWTPLHYATTRNLTEIVDVLLRNGANVNQRTVMENTALHMSVAHPEIVRELLKYKPETGPGDDTGLTPLHIAVMERHTKTVDLLVEKNRNLIHIRDKDGYTPLDMSIEPDYYKTEIFKTLWLKRLKRGFSCNTQGDGDFDTIMYALSRGILEVVRLILKYSPAVAASKNSERFSVLHQAAKYNRLAIMDMLVQAIGDRDVNGPSNDGRRPLHYVAHYATDDAGFEKTIWKLIDLGAEVNAVDSNGQTALHSAAGNGQSKIVTCLLEAGADPNIRNQLNTYTPLHCAVLSAPTLKALLSEGADVDCRVEVVGSTALMHAVGRKSEAGMRMLLDHNASINMTEKNGRTALHIAAEQAGHPEIVRLLLEASADANAADDLGRTPLNCAIKYDDKQSYITKVKHLLKHGAVVNLGDKCGRTPLHIVTSMRWDSGQLTETLVKAYREKGLDIDQKTNDRKTALHCALNLGTYNATKILLENGANLRERDGYGTSCLVLAAYGFDSKLKVQLMLEAERDRQTSPPLWTLADKVAAFIPTGDLRTANMIAQEDRRIFHDANDSYRVLIRCIELGRYEEAKKFLYLGANPFRCSNRSLSAFELATIFKGIHNVFSKACLERFNQHSLGIDALVQIWRLSIEQGWSKAYPKVRFRQMMTMVGWIHTRLGDDGWTINDLLQSDERNSRVAIAPRSIATFRTPTKTFTPSLWTVNESFKEDAIHASSQDRPLLRAFRADNPFPPRGISGALYYFEVEILRYEHSSKAHSTVVVGLCGELADMRYEFPGSDTYGPSIGFNGDDGYIYQSFWGDKISKETGRTFAAGDIIGCGIDWKSGSIYYTLNGDYVGKYIREPRRSLLPASQR